MSIAFSAVELVNIAVDIEKKGIAFYDVMAKTADNKTVRDVFLYLANMEREHIKIFQNMLREADKFKIPEDYAGEYGAYLRGLVDSAVFTDDVVTGNMAADADSDFKALELGINAEKDSILFYYEMRDIVTNTVLVTVNRIIAEEKSHLRKLSQLKKELEKTTG